MKTKLKRILAGGILVWVFPLLATAATIDSILLQTKTILNYVIGILFVLVTLYFIWGVIQYVSASGDEEKLKQGKQHMLWGIIGMVVMAAAWGIVSIVMSTFGVGTGTGGIVVPTGF